MIMSKEKSFDLRKEEAEREWKRLFDEKIRKGYKPHKTIQAIQLEFL